MSVVVGESPTKILPFQEIDPKALTLMAVNDDCLIKVLLFIIVGFK
jgi:hypothetical protein